MDEEMRIMTGFMSWNEIEGGGQRMNMYRIKGREGPGQNVTASSEASPIVDGRIVYIYDEKEEEQE